MNKFQNANQIKKTSSGAGGSFALSCPKCKSTDIEKTKLPNGDTSYRCKKCNERWIRKAK